VTDSLDEPVAPRNLRFRVRYTFIAAVAVLTVLVGIVMYAIREERASTGCGFTPPGREELPGSGSHADWEWWAPGFVCVYTDDHGRVVGRRRP
jgi:hypothetical protein